MHVQPFTFVSLCQSLNIFHTAHVFELLVGKLFAIRDIVPSNRIKHVRNSASRCDSVDGNLSLSTIKGHDPYERLDSALRPGIKRVFGHNIVPTGVGAHEDDTSALGKAFVRFTSEEDLSTCVEAEYSVLLFLSSNSDRKSYYQRVTSSPSHLGDIH